MTSDSSDRRLIPAAVGLGLALVSGCVSRIRNVALGSGDDYPNDPSRSTRLLTIDESLVLEQRNWHQWYFAFDEPASIDYTVEVVEGPELDVIVMSEESYAEFNRANLPEYYSGASALDTDGESVTAELPAGEHRLVVDNTQVGEAEPERRLQLDIAQVEFSAEVYR
jgi:hypothetical protein